jgi:glycopeptide antibiotics resistance protein
MQGNSDQVMNIMAAVIAVYAVIFLVAVIVIIIPFWFILKKAGFSAWLALLNIVPFGTLILLYILAFAEWKTLPQAPVQAWIPPLPPPPQA